jgi:hypothetical protein
MNRKTETKCRNQQEHSLLALFCSRCKAADAKHPRHYDRDHIRNYLDIAIIGPVPGGILCVCKRCGYRYKTNSMAAKRAARRLPNTD